MIALVDYGLGNIQAFASIYRRLGICAQPISTAEALARASRIILPGVGAFDWAMEKLNNSGLREALDEAVMERKVPVLGVCVGMQMMAKQSEEGRAPGLGWVDAWVVRFDTSRFKQHTHLPHMGWNDACPISDHPLFAGLGESSFYFLHSYYFEPGTPDQVLSTTTYGGSFASAISAGNVYGTQFHPEKSHDAGIRLLKNFAGM